MKHNSYSYGLKAAIAILQGICAAVIVAALMTVNYWLDGTWQFSQLGRSFEETAAFLRDTEEMVRKDVNRSVNEALFSTDQVTDLNKEIDIRQYVSGVNDEANRNENLTFRLSDLINYYPKTEALLEVLERFSLSRADGQDPENEKTWEALSQAAQSCEVIAPVSGNSLAETARASQTPYDTLLDYYQSLVLTSREIHERYLDYEEEQQTKQSAQETFVPSNIAYYIENTTNKQYYTNLGVKGVAAARTAIRDDPGMTSLFDGIRTMDIMVANTELTLNQEAATKFMDTVFLGPNERVLIAVNRSYPAGDMLRSDYLAFLKRKPALRLAIGCGVTAACLLLVLLVMSVATTGRSDRRTLLSMKGFDLFATEIAAGLCVVAALSWFYLSRMILHAAILEKYRNAWIILSVVTEYEILLLSLLSLIRRIRHHSLWKNSVTYMILRVSSQVLEARAASTRMLIAYVLVIVLNFLFLRFFQTVGIILAVVIDLALLLYLLRDQVGKLSVRAGLRELSKGRLDYRIDTSSLTGDSLEMAQAVNEMGDGLQEAVDAMVKSERLKAELITNLSHDLKTPLTSIINYTDLLKREKIDNERAMQYIDILDRKSLRLKSLITDLIDVSRISSGNIELNMTQIDLRAMVRMAAGEFEDRFEETGLRMELEASTSLRIRADGDLLFRVLDNLLGNIAKYAMPDTVVKIRIFEEDNRAAATFENQSREKLVKSGQELEERFVRGDVSRNSEGSGLGLSIARSLTELMGGSFRIETAQDTFLAALDFQLLPEDSGS